MQQLHKSAPQFDAVSTFPLNERGAARSGRNSVKNTEKHYAPWVTARQQQFEAAVKNAW